MTRRAAIAVGQEFGRLIVLDPDAGRTAGGRVRVRVLCDPRLGGCGTVDVKDSKHLRNGRTRSCGCQQFSGLDATRHVHGLAHDPLYALWHAMISRCEDPAHPSWPRYGGRADGPPVTVWEPWRQDVVRFVRDVTAEIGPRPAGKTPGGMPFWSINRKDNDGPYAPGNIEWATWPEQARNQTFGGLTTPQRAARNAWIVQARAGGRPYREIAELTGLSFVRVKHIALGIGQGAAVNPTTEPERADAVTAELGEQGRKALALVAEADPMSLFTVASEVEECLRDARGLDEMTDSDWARVARMLRDLPGSYPLVQSCWDAAGKELARG